MATLTRAAPVDAPEPSAVAGPAPDGAAALPTWTTYLRFLRRHRLLLVLLPLIGLAGGVGWARAQPHTYSATTKVVVDPVPAYVTVDSNTRPREVTIDSDAQLALSSRVRSKVAQVVGLSEAEVRAGLTVGAVPLSNVLTITFAADNRDDAVTGSAVASDTFLRVRTRALVALHDAEIDRLARRLQVVQGRLIEQQDINPALSADDPVLRLYRTLQERFVALQDVRVGNARIIAAAQPPKDPDSVDPEVPMTSGFMLGFLAACVVGRIRDALRGPGAGPVGGSEPDLAPDEEAVLGTRRRRAPLHLPDDAHNRDTHEGTGETG